MVDHPLRVLTAMLAALALVGCSKQAASPPPRPAPEVTIVAVRAQSIPYVPSFVAQTESSRQVNIVARVSGYLDKIAYQEGEVVKEGQLLFQLDPKPFQAQLERRARRAGSRSRRGSRPPSAKLGRVKPLAQQNALSQSDLDRAQGEFDSAKAAVFSAQRESDRGRAQPRLHHDPLAGDRAREPRRCSAKARTSTRCRRTRTLTYVAAIDPIWVNFSVSQNQTAKWRDEIEKKLLIEPKNRDYEVEIVLSDGTPYPYKGKINFSDPSFSQDTGSFLVRAVLPNPKRELRPGMFVTAHAKGALRPNAIVVPQLAVQQGSNGHLVYVVKQDGSAEVRPVVVGDYYGEKEIVIRTGLHAGDRVVVDGVLRVVPGQPVKIVGAGRGRRRRARTAAEGRRSEEVGATAVFTHFFIDRPILSSVISILILLGGAVAMLVSPISQYPGARAAAGDGRGALPGRDRRGHCQHRRLADRGADQRHRQPALLQLGQLVERQRLDHRGVPPGQRSGHQPGQRPEPRQPGAAAHSRRSCRSRASRWRRSRRAS